jgi:hypothetical protein
MASYRNLGSDCSNYDLRYGATPDLSAEFTFVVPNLVNDMHDGTVADGDRSLAGYIPAVMATPEYKSGTTAIFLLWDEDGGLCSA